MRLVVTRTLSERGNSRICSQQVGTERPPGLGRFCRRSTHPKNLVQINDGAFKRRRGQRLPFAVQAHHLESAPSSRSTVAVRASGSTSQYSRSPHFSYRVRLSVRSRPAVEGDRISTTKSGTPRTFAPSPFNGPQLPAKDSSRTACNKKRGASGRNRPPTPRWPSAVCDAY